MADGEINRRPEAYKWHRSDFDYVAYPFTHAMFEEIVNDGNLK